MVENRGSGQNGPVKAPHLGDQGSGADAEVDGVRLARLAQAGDRSALAELCERYRPLLARISGRYRSLPTGVEAGDVEQEAARALCELVLEYRPDRGIRLQAYLKAKLGWRVSHYLRAEARRTGHLPLDSLDPETIPNAIVEMPAPGIASRRVARALGRLSPRQRAVIAGFFWRDRAVAELAKEMGITKQAVTALRRRAEASLRSDLRHEAAEEED